jgi:RHS repeat-associated protein
VFASVNTAPAYSYDAYGVALQGTAPLANLNYAGMFLNSDSGLYLTQYRAYDPIVGRWLSRDPLTEVGDVNLYRYVGDAPTVYRDPSGLWQVTVSGGDGIGGIVTIGYNSGQWSFGAWGGVGAGLSARYDPENKPCQPTGFVPSARINANWQAGSFGGGGKMELLPHLTPEALRDLSHTEKVSPAALRRILSIRQLTFQHQH